MPAVAPPPVPPGRALALLGALHERAQARLALHQTLFEMESRLARTEPVPMEVLQEFEARMGQLKAAQERISSLSRT